MGFTIDTSYITPRGMLAGAIVPTVLAIIAVMLRFYVRRMKKQDLLWDDWLLIPALVGTPTNKGNLYLAYGVDTRPVRQG